MVWVQAAALKKREDYLKLEMRCLDLYEERARDKASHQSFQNKTHFMLLVGWFCHTLQHIPCDACMEHAYSCHANHTEPEVQQPSSMLVKG